MNSSSVFVDGTGILLVQILLPGHSMWQDSRRNRVAGAAKPRGQAGLAHEVGRE